MAIRPKKKSRHTGAKKVILLVSGPGFIFSGAIIAISGVFTPEALN